MTNKIIMNESKISIDNEKVSLRINTSQLILDIYNYVEIEDIDNNQDMDLIINMHPKSHLLYNKYNKDSGRLNIIINEESDSDLIFNYSLLETKKTFVRIESNIKKSNNKCILNVHGVTTNNGKIVIEATGKIFKNVDSTEMLENIRIITLNDEENIIIPNLLVESNDVSVNHNATISGVNDDYLFYLSSKGISLNSAKKLIAEGFLKNNLKIEDKEGITIE